MKNRWLLMVIAVLLALNVAVTLVGWLADPPAAQADVVAGKNWFSTSSPDGRTVYLWQYWTSSSVGEGATGQIQYYGQITVDQRFEAAGR